jgi:hypothetical protein
MSGTLGMEHYQSIGEEEVHERAYWQFVGSGDDA